MSNFKLRMVEVCEDCDELIEHCVCEEVCIDEEYDECEDCCCEDCEFEDDFELTDEQEEEFKLLMHYLNEILEVNGCPQCIYEILMDATQTFRDIGRKDMRDLMVEVLGFIE